MRRPLLLLLLGAALIGGPRPAWAQGPFTDDSLVPGTTPIKALHLIELRARIDVLRQRTGLSPFSWTDATILPGATPVRAVHVQELQTALTQAFAAVPLAPPSYQHSVAAGGPILAEPFTELRAFVKILEASDAVSLIVARVVVTPSPAVVALGSTASLFAMAYNWSNLPVPGVVFAWTSSNTSAVAVAGTSATTGSVTGAGAGSATIAATPVVGAVGSTAVTVTSAPPDPPVISSVSPTSGAAGTSVTIAGSGFGSTEGAGTAWLGTRLGAVTTWSDTQIVATVATGASSGTVQVRQNGLGSNAVSFTVPTPTLTNVTPSGGAASTQVTLTGSGFGATQGAGLVALGTAPGVVTSWSDTQVVATVTAGAASGNAQILQNGVWSNAVAFTVGGQPPHITYLTPDTGSASTAVTLYGTDFGVSQASGTVSIGGASASVSSWSDTQVVATVAAGAVSGVAKLQQNGIWTNAVTFTVPPTGNAPAITLTPNVLSLLVGETRAIQSLNAQSTPVTGLGWTSSDAAVVTLSSADPPVLTAVAPGHVTITAGGASSDVTVYAGPALPTGTVLWSNPGNGSGVWDLSVAVPSYSGVADVFAVQNDGSVQAIASDGTVGWTTTPPGDNFFLADFQGGLVAADWAGQAITRLDGLTGQAAPTFAATTDAAKAWGLGDPAIHPDGTIFTVDFSCTSASCGNTDDATTGSWVVGINPATGTAKFRVPLALSAWTSQVSDAVFCQDSTPGFSVSTYPGWPSQTMRIAGDGYAYLSYTTIASTGTLQRSAAQPYPEAAYDAFDQLLSDTNGSQFSAAIADLTALWEAIGQAYNPNDPLLEALQASNRTAALAIEDTWAVRYRRLCDRQGSSVTTMHVLRVGSDGASSDVVVKAWAEHHSETYTLTADAPGYHLTQIQSGPAHESFSGPAIITNADTGALYSWDVGLICYQEIQTDATCQDGSGSHLTTWTGDTVSDVVWEPGVFTDAVQPALQLEDGSFVGRAYGNAGAALLVFDAGGHVKWTLPGSDPVMATAGGGLIASSAAGASAFDANGNATGPVADVPIQSWLGNAYRLGSVEQFVSPVYAVAGTFGALRGGNASGNGTAIKQVLSNQAQGSDEQLPQSDATLHTNYNSIELLTDRSPSQILSAYLQTFAGVKQATNHVAYVTSTTPVTSVCQQVTFELRGLLSLFRDPFSVGITQLDAATNTMSAVTLRGHPLAGWRYWRAFSVGTNDVVVETGAVDTNGPGWRNYVGYYVLSGQQTKIWQDELLYILSDLHAQGSGQQGSNPTYNIVNGKWDYIDPGSILSHVNQHLPGSCQ